MININWDWYFLTIIPLYILYFGVSFILDMMTYYHYFLIFFYGKSHLTKHRLTQNDQLGTYTKLLQTENIDKHKLFAEWSHKWLNDYVMVLKMLLLTF